MKEEKKENVDELVTRVLEGKVTREDLKKAIQNNPEWDERMRKSRPEGSWG